MTVPVVILLDGVLYAAVLFLVSAGLTLVYGVMRILNIAHGSLYALGAYAGTYLVLVYLRTGGPAPLMYLALLAGALLAGAISGPLVERLLLRPIYAREEVVGQTLAYGEAAIGEANRRLHDFFPRLRAVALERELEAGHGAGHRGGARSG